MFLSVDACFGLPRKKTSGASYRSPLSENMFFHKQKNVDSFMSAYPSSKTEPVVRYLFLDGICLIFHHIYRLYYKCVPIYWSID